MAFISASGTRRAGPILVLAALVTTLPLLSAATLPAAPSVDVSVEGLRNSKGQLLVCLTSNPKAFPDCSSDAGSVRLAVKVADAGSFRIVAPSAGTYAIAVVHDENSNDRMDKALFLPREGFGFSRNPTITVGPPSFRSANFAIEGRTHQSIQMKYML